MKTSRIIFISFISFIGIILLAFMFLGIVFKDKRIRERRQLQIPGITIALDKPFKHVYIKTESVNYRGDKQKEIIDKKRGKDYSSYIDESKKKVKPNQSLKEETRSQNAENGELFKSFYGEWYQKDGNREYNGILIRPDFMEHFYQACIYNKIVKEDDSYIITVKCDNGTTATYKIQQISKDKIKVELPGGEVAIFDKVDCPLNGRRVNPGSLPKQLKKRWYTTNGKNNLEFDLIGDGLIFKGSKYRIEEIVFFREKWGKQYRIIAKNSEGKAMMFYLKNWSDRYCQIGYNGKNGDLYKNNPAYSNINLYNFYGLNESRVLISQGNEQELIYYRYEDTDSLNAPVIEVKNDTLYLITNSELQISLSMDSLVSVDGIDCQTMLFSFKQPALNVHVENGSIYLNDVEVQNLTVKIIDDSFLDISNNLVADTIRLNVNHSRINKRNQSSNKVSLIMGTIENRSDVTLPKAKHIQLDADNTSQVRFW